MGVNGPMETVLFTQGGVVLDRVAAAEVITYKKIDEVDGTNADDETGFVLDEEDWDFGRGPT